MPLFNIETTSTPTLVKRYQVEAANEEEAENRYFDKGVCVKETENGKEESGGEEVDEVKEIK